MRMMPEGSWEEPPVGNVRAWPEFLVALLEKPAILLLVLHKTCVSLYSQGLLQNQNLLVAVSTW